MNEIKYLNHAPSVYRIKARHLEVGMFHLAMYANDSYEIARIRGVEAISDDCIRIDLGPVGHANRVVSRDQYVDVPLLHCPKCLEDTLTHVVAAVDIDNHKEARKWFQQGRKFLSNRQDG